MPSDAETTVRSRFLRSMAGVALALAVCAGLAGCGGSGPGGGDQVIIVPDPPRKFPDLVVESAVASDSGPSTGAGFTLSVTVRNAGDGAAAASTVRFYRSADAAITATDEGVGSAAVGELAASGSVGASVELTAPSEPGTYYYGACVDAVAEESDTGNNCSASVRVTVPEPPPDLVVESATASDAGPAAGSGFTLSVTVRNAGDGAAAASTVRFYRSADAAITATDEGVGSAAVGELAASGSVGASVELTAPSSPGTYYYGACVDAVAEESDAENNCSASVQVVVPAARTTAPQTLAPVRLVPKPPPGPPDLVLESPAVEVRYPRVPVPEAYFRLSATVRNAGGGTTPRTTMRFYSLKGATITSSDTLVYVGNVPELNAGGSFYRKSGHGIHYRDTDMRLPVEPGTYYYGVCVDAVEGESDTSNNCGVAQVTASAPDLVVDSVEASPAGPAAGGVFDLKAKVRTVGQRTEWFWVRFYRSDDATFTASDPQVGSYFIGRRFFSTSLAYPNVRLDAPSSLGTYYYRACADAVFGESNRTNNCSPALKVVVTHANPELFIASRSSTETSAGLVGLNVTVVNLGGPAPATTLRFYRSTDRKFTADDVLEQTVSVPVMTKREANKAPRFWSNWVWVTPPSAPGWYHYGACVGTVPNESNTTNNCAYLRRVIRR